MCVFLKCVLTPGYFDSQLDSSASTSEKIRVSAWKVPITHPVSWCLWCVCEREKGREVGRREKQQERETEQQQQESAGRHEQGENQK